MTLQSVMLTVLDRRTSRERWLVWVCDTAPGVRDEAPAAYKDINKVGPCQVFSMRFLQ